MADYKKFSVLMILIVIVSGCSPKGVEFSPTQSPTPFPPTATISPTSVPQLTLTPSPIPAADTPRFELDDCQFQVPYYYEVECGYLVVLEDRSVVDGPEIRLPVAIFKSTGDNPEPDPVIHLVGGPGGSILDAVDSYLNVGGNHILLKRDYILFNQRGTHYAEPFLECPAYTQFQRDLAAQGLSLDERNRQEVAFMLDCQDKLLNSGINLSAYNSAENAADIEDLRIVLGYEQVNLYGISYGSRLALTVMRDYPEGIRSVILDAVFPLQANLDHELALNVYHSLNAVFAACAADEDCRQKYPNLEASFYQVVDDLNTNPVSLELSEGTVVVDGYVFLDMIFRFLYSIEVIPWIPYIIDQASQNQYDPSLFAMGDDMNLFGFGMHYSILCREEMAFENQEEAFAIAADLPPVFGEYFAGEYDWAVCKLWQAGKADPVENQPVVSDIPTLVFAGSFDPVTPPAWARLAAETLSNSFFYEFPNMAHGVMRSDSCALEIGLQFLDDPLTEPDASCMDDIQPIQFQ